MVVNVIMTTYFSDDAPEREDYAVESLHSLLDNLHASDGLRLIISDDSEAPSGVAEQLLHMPEAAGYHLWHSTTYSCSEHSGIGASLNKSLRAVGEAGYWMYTTDDWRLESPLSLDGPSKLLRQGYDLVRLGPVHPDLQCVTRFQAGLGWWLDLRQEYGGFAFATRPFLATRAFYDKIGPFDERLNSYETERLYAERVARSTCRLAYWGGVNLAGPWHHVGLVNVGYKDVD